MAREPTALPACVPADEAADVHALGTITRRLAELVGTDAGLSFDEAREVGELLLRRAVVSDRIALRNHVEAIRLSAMVNAQIGDQGRALAAAVNAVVRFHGEQLARLAERIDALESAGR